MFGFVHLIHAPILILFPFMVNNFITDILYIIYFLFVLFLYTFINGECPISYMYKLSIDENYIAGNISYPEMESIFHNEKITEYYFGITTCLYIASLLYVLFRTKTFFKLIFTNIVILVYLFCIHNNIYFEIVQEITKYVLFFTIFIFYLDFLMPINAL
jgi:hypothetical protein